MSSPAVLNAAAKENTDPIATGPAQKMIKMERFLVKKLSENAVLPKRGSDKAAGYDLCRWVPTQSPKAAA